MTQVGPAWVLGPLGNQEEDRALTVGAGGTAPEEKRGIIINCRGSEGGRRSGWLFPAVITRSTHLPRPSHGAAAHLSKMIPCHPHARTVPALHPPWGAKGRPSIFREGQCRTPSCVGAAGWHSSGSSQSWAPLPPGSLFPLRTLRAVSCACALTPSWSWPAEGLLACTICLGNAGWIN